MARCLSCGSVRIPTKWMRAPLHHLLKFGMTIVGDERGESRGNDASDPCGSCRVDVMLADNRE